MSKKMKVFIIVAACVVIMIVGMIIVSSVFGNNLDELADMEIADVDLTMIEDGTYTGLYYVFPISVEVDVIVRDHVITEIDIVKHTNGQGEPGEAVVDEVLQSQTLQVDTISGATYSSKVILLAIHDALTRTE